MRPVGHIARMGENRGVYRVSTENPEGNRPLGRPRSRWEDSIKMHLRGNLWQGMDWFDLTENRDRWRALVNAVMNFPVP